MSVDANGKRIRKGDLVVEVDFPDLINKIDGIHGDTIIISRGVMTAGIWSRRVRKATKQEIEKWMLEKMESSN